MDTNLIPVILPSGGLFYSGKCPGGTIQIRPWTTEQEEFIVQQSTNSGRELIDSLIKDNVKWPEGMTYEDLLSGDQQFLLVQLRCASTVPYQSFNWDCGFCGRKDNVHQLHWLEHPIQVPYTLNTDREIVPDPGWPKEPIEVLLPKSGTKVGLRYLRVSDQAAADNWRKQRAGKTEGIYTFLLARQILTINGESKQWNAIYEFVQNLLALDAQILDSALDEYHIGYLTTVNVICQNEKCRRNVQVQIPRDLSFFRPLREDIDRYIKENTRSNKKASKLSG